MSQSHARGLSGQVWLPNLKVWAKMPDASTQQVQANSVTQRPSSSGVGQEVRCFCAALAKTHGDEKAKCCRWCTCDPGSHTALSLAAQPSQPDSDVECLETEEAIDEAESDEESGLPTCPICLGEIFDVRDKAVVISCMHVFCLACLSRWSALKRTCPLCKSCIQGYMYNITSETDYSERLLPPTPPREKEASPPMAERHISRRAIIDEPPAGAPLAQQGRLQNAAPRAGERPLVASSTGHRRAIFRQSCSSHQDEWVTGSWPPRRVAQQRQALSSSGSQQRSEPRPYFYRVQAQAQSQAQAAARERNDVTRSPQDAAETWRRHIYVEGLYAQPMETGPAVAVPPVMPEERKQQRVEAWVDRELRALLQTDDIAIVRAYVMGLVRGIGFAARQEGAEGSAGRAAGSARTDATAALKPFLHEHAAHFWHELRCFAAVSVSMQTYDRLVSYRPRAPSDSLANLAGQQSSAGASSASHRPRSSSGDRHTCEGAAQRASRSIEAAQQSNFRSRSERSPSEPPTSTARQQQSSQVNVASGGGYKCSHSRAAESSQEREAHRAPDSKRRRQFSNQPPPHEHRTNSRHSRDLGAQPRPSKHSAGRNVEDGQSSGSDGRRAHSPVHMKGSRDEGNSRDGKNVSAGRSIQSRPHKPNTHGNRGGHAQLAGEDVLAELRARALAAVKAHREHP